MNIKLASLTRSVDDAYSRSANRYASATTDVRTTYDSLGAVDTPADRLWGAQTRRSLEYFSIGQDLMPCETITTYAILKRSAAIANHNGGQLDDEAYDLI